MKDLAVLQDDSYEYRIHGSIAAETEILQKSTVTAKSKQKWKQNATKNRQSRKGASVKKKAKMLQPINMTSTNNNPFEGQEVCFDVSGILGHYFLKHFQLESFPSDALHNQNDKLYLKGVVGECTVKSGNLYKIDWNFTGLKSMNVAGTYILSGILLANQLSQRREIDHEKEIMQKFFNKSELFHDGDPLESDVEMDDDECCNVGHESKKVRTNNLPMYQRIVSDNTCNTKMTNGILWEKDVDLPAPEKKSSLGSSFIKPKYSANFKTELESFLAFLPLSLWERIVIETNRYAHQQMDTKKTCCISGNRWQAGVSLQELMTFIGIMVLATLDPTPGRTLQFLFQNPAKYPYTKAMTWLRF